MNTFWYISLIILWTVVLLNLWLTLRIVNWLQSVRANREQYAEVEDRPELIIGSPAPEFQAKTLLGQPIRLNQYVQKPVVFFFMSPHCGICRDRLPVLNELSMAAKARSSTEFVVVSNENTAETFTWIETIRQEDNTEINLPILVAPRSSSDFLKDYNPRNVHPYYCLINSEGIVQSRGPIGIGEWLDLEREWRGSPKVEKRQRPLGLYR